MNEITTGSFPAELNIAGRIYEILNFLDFLKGSLPFVHGSTMVRIAKKVAAHLGEEEALHILEHQDEMPVAFRGVIVFVFTDWCKNGDDGLKYVNCVFWHEDCWVSFALCLDDIWGGFYRLLRRKA